ncbi:dual OB domain-containing protein [Fictibacillus gelatini]|uniref:dual OB domain-containing protein n=1 Tax=Fictibacillus gelatini TaxID=225985 RepID=UPI000426AC30|nr:hypothetical protein [Fictibacillus gelatini]
MGNSLSITILAVTKTFDSYCIAGMDDKGNWYRPLPNFGGKFWPQLRYQDGSWIQVGDVWEINDYISEFDPISPAHTEDIRLITPPIQIKRLSNKELIQFAYQNQENNSKLQNTLDANGRSLCLVSANNFEGFSHTFNNRIRPRVKFVANGVAYDNMTSTPGFPLTDLKWRAYILQNRDYPKDLNSAFICIGLARKEPSKNIIKEYPMVISIITDPEVPLLPSYPN